MVLPRGSFCSVLLAHCTKVFWVHVGFLDRFHVSNPLFSYNVHSGGLIIAFLHCKAVFLEQTLLQGCPLQIARFNIYLLAWRGMSLGADNTTVFVCSSELCSGTAAADCRFSSMFSTELQAVSACWCQPTHPRLKQRAAVTFCKLGWDYHGMTDSGFKCSNMHCIFEKYAVISKLVVSFLLLLQVLYFCECSLKFFSHRKSMLRHLRKVKIRHPPGDEIYRRGNISVFEVWDLVVHFNCIVCSAHLLDCVQQFLPPYQCLHTRITPAEPL